MAETPTNSPTSPDPGSRKDSDLIADALRQAQAATPASAPSAGAIPGSTGNSAVETMLAAEVFPGYEIIRQIHEGGQGVVYQALQASTKKKVAIKVMRQGPFASVKEKTRFEREIEILAQLNHPNIVAVHDSGMVQSPQGALHFFVMDYISGRSLGSFLKQSKLGGDEVLRLFVKIGDAVNAAHLKGVIHRDLKPDNIRIDSSSEPHILDFGLAKTTGSADGDESETAMTLTGDFLGTPLYASPEQAARDVSKIDVRTDVHALGVMLFEALTGRLPYGAISNRRDVLDAILHSEPARARSFSKQVNDEVDTIVAKAISKEPERRYQNAGEFARDLRHYLSGEAIEAKRDSGWYVVRKQMKRHRVGVFAACICLIAIVVGGTAAVFGWREAERQRKVAEAATVDALEQKGRAEQEAKRLERVQGILGSILSGSDPDLLKGRDPSLVLELLTQATLRARSELADDPQVLATVLDVVGRSYGSLSIIPQAEQQLQQALQLRQQAGPESLDVATSLLALADLRRLERKHEACKDLASKALAMRLKLLPSDDPAIAECEDRLGHAAWDAGQYVEAEEHYRKSLVIRETKFGATSAQAAESQSNLGTALTSQGKADEAILALDRALAAVLASLGEKSIPVCICRANLAMALKDRAKGDDISRGVVLAKQAVDTYRELLNALNPDHPYISNALHKYGQVLLAAGKTKDAESSIRESLERRLRGSPNNEYAIGATTLSLGLVLLEEQRYAEALDTLEQARQAVLRTRGSEHPTYLRCLRAIERAQKAIQK